MVLLGLLLLTFSVGFSIERDPFVNNEDAVGYIVVEENGVSKKYIVLEGKDGSVKLIETNYEPQKVLKKGGKKR